MPIALPRSPMSTAADVSTTPSVEQGADESVTPPAAGLAQRLHWVCLSPALQWVVLRCCLSTADLRELMARFTDVLNRSDFELQCEAARQTARNATAARWLQSRLDSRCATAVQRVSAVETEEGILALWEEALSSGDARQTYWAIVTDRRTSSRLGLLVSRELDDRRQTELLQEQAASAAAERDRDAAEKSVLRMQAASMEETWRMSSKLLQAAKEARERAESLSSALMFQVGRREQAEMNALAAESDALRLQQESEQLKYLLGELGGELSAVEEQLRCSIAPIEPVPNPLRRWIEGRKVLYMGGRPSANPSIRSLVETLGGEYQRHEGHIDTRSGPLTETLTWPDLVVAPMDGMDRDSAVALRQACALNGIDYVALRTASLASFVAGIGNLFRTSRPAPMNQLCLRHG